MLLSNHSIDSLKGDEVSGGRKRAAVVWLALISAQLLGYLLVWFYLHRLPEMAASSSGLQGSASADLQHQSPAHEASVARLPWIGAVLDHPQARKVLFIAGLLIASGAYVGSLMLARQTPQGIKRRWLALAATVMALPLLVLVPDMLSTDVWSYIMSGRIAVLHGGNPLVDAPAAYGGDPFLSRVFWRAIPSVYGPSWVAASSVLTRVAQVMGGSTGAYLFTFKGFILVCHLLNVLLLGRILRAIQPGRETLGMVLYGWNPLVLIEFAGGGHNDCFMLTLLLAGVACAVAGRTTIAVGWMTAAGLAKLPGMLALPAFTLLIARRPPGRGLPTLVRHLLVAAAVAIALYAPYWRGTQTFKALSSAPNLTVMHDSPAAEVSHWMETHLTGTRIGGWLEGDAGPEHAVARIRTVVRSACLLCFVGCVLVMTLRPAHGWHSWIEGAVWINLAWMLFVAFQFNPWYGTWLVPLAAILRKSSMHLVAMSLAFLLFHLPFEIPHLALIAFAPVFFLILGQLPRLLPRERQSLPLFELKSKVAEPVDAAA